MNFDEDYFENGVQKRVSGYTNYHWKPEYVLPLANWLKKKYGNKVSYFDYGCAKGFLVKALRLLNCEAYGYDISKYAINNAETEIKDYVSTELEGQYDIIIAKDILEHVPEDKINYELNLFRELNADYVIAIIPLGDDDKFRIREYELDVTHVTKKDEVWWINEFRKVDFVCDEFYYNIDGIKDNWTKNFPYGNAIFIFKRI